MIIQVVNNVSGMLQVVSIVTYAAIAFMGLMIGRA